MRALPAIRGALPASSLQPPVAVSHVAAGYYLDDTMAGPQPCPEDTFASAPRLATAAATCTPCPAGWSTSGLVAQLACGLSGELFSEESGLGSGVRVCARALLLCLPHSLLLVRSSHRVIPPCMVVATPADGFVAAGFYYDGRVAEPCPVDTYSPTSRNSSEAPSCTLCAAGMSTANLDTQRNCSEQGMRGRGRWLGLGRCW